MLGPFLAEIDQRVLVCDGAMGTMLYSKGVFVNRCFESLNLSEPDLVAEVHLDYVRAGADVLETNTFGANRVKLGSFGLAEKVHAINVAGARVARHAAREQAYVAGAIGPLGIRIEPWGKTGVDEAEAIFREQAAALLEGRVDLFILETFRDLNEMGAAISAVRSVCDLPIVAQMTIEEHGNTLDGTPPERFGPELVRRGAHLVGVNCSVGPAAMLETIERIAAAVRRAAGRPAERRQAAARRGPDDLPVVARVHGVLRAAVQLDGRPAGRRLLRNDARAHPPDEAGGRRQAPRPAAGAPRGSAR